ncbi:MAG TPA: hypothetical protein VEL06_03440 [Haliangiales bacterium]|nr:hypothetical protein [Haliangiales bacterium]
MKKFLPIVLAFATAAGLVRSEEKIALLKAGSKTFTNVVVLDRSPVELTIKHAGGLATLKLKELDGEYQKKFGYDPAKAAELEKSRAPAPVAAAVAGPEMVQKDYPLRDRGRLFLTFPKTWTDAARQSPASLPPGLTVQFSPLAGKDFKVLLTALPNGPPLSEKKLGREELKHVLEMSARPALATAEEKQLVFSDLNGAEVTGYFLSLTDTTVSTGEPPSGSYKYLTLGIVTFGDLIANFTILSNTADSDEKKAAIEMVKTARLKQN